MKLQGQTALITGASRGIGRAIALAFAREGADLALTATAVPELTAVRDEVSQLGVRCTVIPADLARRDAVDEIFEAVEFDHIDILVNNAGIGSSANPKPVVSLEDDFWEKTLFINLTVPFQFCKKVLPSMLARRYGRIINIASINGKVGMLHGAAYVASKHGLLGLTRSLALEVVGDGITVNAICPGATRTLINNKRVAYDAQRLGKTYEEIEASLTPLGRRLEAEEIAPLAVYLAGKDAGAVTGQAWNIDGGAVMW